MTLPECTQLAEAGHLYAVATPIGNLGDVSSRLFSIVNSCDLIACEDTRVTKKLLNRLNIVKDMISYRQETEQKETPKLLERLQNGESIALLCDAGTPTLSDPGFRIVRECKRFNIPVVPISGPSAFLTALSASGLPSNQFTFRGFLQQKSASRKRNFEALKESESTVIFYESSHRIEKFLSELSGILEPDRVICIARELTKQHETILTGKLSEVLNTFETLSHKGEFVILIAGKDYEL